MLILAIRTDKPEAEIGLFKDNQQLAYVTWQAHRQLAETIHSQIENLLKAYAYKLGDIEGIAVYKGPGSFTGLRIGLTVANTLASTKCVPIVAENQEEWLKTSTLRLLSGEDEKIVLPYYGSPPHVTLPKR